MSNKSLTLAERIKNYEKTTDYQLMNRVPVVLRLDGKNFSKITDKLEKPNFDFSKLIGKTLIDTIENIDDAVFGFANSDELTILLRNDGSKQSIPWFNNRIQKIVSIAASTATYYFNENANSETFNHLKLKNCIFDCRIFTVPNAMEAANAIAHRQQDCLKNAITCATENALRDKIGTAKTRELMHGKNSQQRIELLNEHCGLVFSKDYPAFYSFGFAAYKQNTIQICKNQQGEECQSIRNKWVLDMNLPNFILDKTMIVKLFENNNNE